MKYNRTIKVRRFKRKISAARRESNYEQLIAAGWPCGVSIARPPEIKPDENAHIAGMNIALMCKAEAAMAEKVQGI